MLHANREAHRDSTAIVFHGGMDRLRKSMWMLAAAAVAFGLFPRVAFAGSDAHPVVTELYAQSLSMCPGEPFYFHVTAEDADGFIVQYEWNFQDGSAWITGGPDMTWAFAKDKKYNVGVRVTDNDGKKVVEHLKVNVGCDDDDACGEDDDDDDDGKQEKDKDDDDDGESDCDLGSSKPVITIEVSSDSPVLGEEITFTATPSGDGDVVTAVNWDFGDGGAATGNPVTHAYSAASDGYVITATALDDDGETFTAVVAFPVSPPTPAIEAGIVDGAKLTIRITPFTGAIEVIHG